MRAYDIISVGFGHFYHVTLPGQKGQIELKIETFSNQLGHFNLERKTKVKTKNKDIPHCGDN